MIGQLQYKLEKFVGIAALNAALLFTSTIAKKYRRKFFSSLIVSLLMLMMNFSHAWAQVSLKELSINYKELRLDKGYSIIYDNPNATAKLNEFKIKFYKDAAFVDETGIETFPPNGTIVPYGLTNSVIGFNKAELSIISLHAGNIIDFPSSAASIIALNEPTEVKPTDSESTPTEAVNKPPLANDTIFEIDATADTLVRSITNQYSDPDGDIVTVTEASKVGPPLSYKLSNNGALTLTAPSVTGTYTFPYEVKDNQGASASADVSIAVVFPKATTSSLAEHIEAVEQLLSQIDDKKTELSNLPAVSQALMNRREDLLADNKSLESKASDPKLLTLTTDIAELTEALELSKNTVSVDDLLNSLGDLSAQSLALQAQLQTLQSHSLEEGLDINSFKAELTTLAGNLDTFKNKENTIIAPALLTLAQMEEWEAQHQRLKQQIPSPPLKWLPVALVVLTLGALVFWALKKPRQPSPNVQPNLKKGNEKNDKEKALMSFPVYVVSREGSNFTTKIKTYPDDMRNFNSDKNGFITPMPSGKIFPENPSFQTIDNSAKTALSNLWETAYDATGRVGLAQAEVPNGRDDCLGTAILVAENYIITNRHVFDNDYDRIMDPEELVGIEFYGELNTDKTEFYKISNEEIYILEERDAIILKLEKTVDRRAPIQFSQEAPQTYEADDIMIVGYPVKPNEADLTSEELAVFGGLEIFSVKRVSEGRIFSHKYDLDKDFIVETKTSGEYSENKYQPAISYNVSTLPGNSGSPVISKKTGDVIGLHFGDGLFKEQPANVGHSGQILAGFVTYVTSGQARNMVNEV